MNNIQIKLSKLIKDGENVKKVNYHYVEEKGLNMHDYISGDEYNLWMNSIKIFADKHLNEHSLYTDIISTYNNRNKAYKTISSYNNMMGYLKAIYEEDNLMEEKKPIAIEDNECNKKLVFISHATKDKDIVGYFIDDILIGVLGFHHSQIFCTSSDGMKIESGEDWREEIKKNIKNAKITFLIITPYYKSSEICLNEMGASWVLNGKVIPIIVEPINYDSVGILEETKQLEKLNSEESLDRIKDIIERIFEGYLPKNRSDRWTSKKKEFLSKLKDYLQNNSFPKPVTTDVVNKLQLDFDNLKIIYDELLKEKIILEKVVKEFESPDNKKDITKIKIKYGIVTGIDEFEKINKRVLSSLKNVNSTVVTMLYNEYTGHELKVDYTRSYAYIEEAKARGFLDNDLNVLWGDTEEMKEISEALDAMKIFLTKDCKITTYDAIVEEYPSVPIDIDNLSFWQKVIGIKFNYEC